MYFLLGVLCFYCHCLVWYCTFVQNYFPFRQITWMCWWKDKWNKFWYLVKYCIPQADRKLRLDFKANKMGPTHSWWVIFFYSKCSKKHHSNLWSKSKNLSLIHITKNKTTEKKNSNQALQTMWKWKIQLQAEE